MRYQLLSPLSHLLEYALIKRSRLFDEQYYLHTYPEVQKANNNPVRHYLRDGWRQGCNPSPHFDTNFYLNEYPDVRQAGVNPFVHFIRKGRVENRMPRASKDRLYPRYPLWVKQFDTLTNKENREIKQKIKNFSYQPKFTILIIIDPAQEDQIKQTLSSLRSQLYQNWEAFLFANTKSGMSTKLQAITKALSDPRIALTSYEDKTACSQSLNQTLERCAGDFLGVLPPGAALSPHTLYLLANEINQHANAAVLYTDEDRLNANGLRISPDFKPEWNPELFLHQDYLNDFAVYRKDLVKTVGGFYHGNPNLLAYDLAMRITEIISPDSICHIPFALCHKPEGFEWPPSPASPTTSSPEYIDVLKSHFNRTGEGVAVEPAEGPGDRIVYPLPDPKPAVSIIIPTRNGRQILARCLESIFLHTSYDNFEILIVDNQSDDPEALTYFDTLKHNEKIAVLPYQQPFNFSAINNYAAGEAQGEILVFLNNDVEVITQNWLSALVRHTLRPEIGAVGAMLYYPDDTIQHAGVVLGMNGPAGHIYKGQPRGYHGVRSRATLVQNIDAITGACMAVHKKKFLQLSGFDEEHLPIAFNDIDLCIRLQQAGYHNLWTPHVELYHHESATRGSDEVPKNNARFTSEAEYIFNTYGEIIMSYPAYNPNLSLVSYNLNLAFPPRVKKPWLEK